MLTGGGNPPDCGDRRRPSWSRSSSSSPRARGLSVKLYESRRGGAVRTCASGAMFACSHHGAIASTRPQARFSNEAVGACRQPTPIRRVPSWSPTILILSQRPQKLAPIIETEARVVAISPHGIDKVVSRGREIRPFVLSVG